MAGWHHWHNGHGFGWTPGVGDGQGGLGATVHWGHKESDMTERLNWIELKRNRKAHPKIYMESQGTPNSQKNFGKEQSWRTPTFWFPRCTIHVLESKDCGTGIWVRRIDQWNRKPRNKSSHICSVDFQECQGHLIGKRETFQKMVLRKLNIHVQKNEIRPLPYIIYK